MDEVFGHDKQREHFLQSLKELPSSLIFYGPSGVGKKKLIQGLLQILNCSRDALACGHCSNCTRSLEKKNEMILQVNLEEKKSISVDQIRDVQDFISLKTLSSARFIIIDPADKLTVQASNALLKMLEEPPERTHFFLLSETLSSLLPTIRSRSSIFRFNPLSEDSLRKIEGIEEDAISWSRGRADMALALSSEGGREGLSQAQSMLLTLLQSAPIDWKKTFPSFFQDQNGHRFFVPLWEEMIKKALRGESFSGQEHLPEQDSALLALFENIQDLGRELSKSFDKLLCLENFYYEVKKAQQNPEQALWN